MKQWHILVIAATVSLLLGLTGYFYYKTEYRSITQKREYEITTIGTLKIDQIEQWHADKLADATVMQHSTFIQHEIGKLVRAHDDTALDREIRSHLVRPKKEFGFENIFLAAPDGRLLLSLDTTVHVLCATTQGMIRSALRTGDVVSSDFYYCQLHHKVHFDLIAPLTDADKRRSAVIIYRLDPNDYLYPLIQSWPTPSQTAETMLLRRSDDSVVFLNDLRYRPNSALQYTLPLSALRLTTKQMVHGYTGMYRGTDYRGVPVIGFIGPITGTPWLLLAKVDRAEIFAELYYRAAITGILTLVLILLVISGSAFFYKSRQKNLYLTLFEKEKDFHERLEEFKTILYSIADGVVTTDCDGKIMQMNHAAAELTGWSEAEAQGQPFRNIVTIVNEATHRTIDDPIGRVLKEGAVVDAGNHTLLVSRNGREIPIAENAAPVKNDRGKIEGTVLVFRNKTEEHHAEEERKRLEYHLYRSQRAESIGTLAAGIAHDFNNILNVIVGNAELLASSPYDPEKSARRVTSIIKASERGTNVVRQLLAVARKTEIQHLPISVNDIILELSKLLEETFPRTITIVTELSPELPKADGDADQLHQVLLNLSVNARDAMPEGGTLSFTTGVAEGQSIRDRLPVAREIPYITIGVRDTGKGMDEATRKQIFDPFFTTKEKGKGTGLGLAVAQGIIESHEGGISVWSRPGEGTQFDIFLPTAPAEQVSEEPVVSDGTSLPNGSETILLIEDEEPILAVTEELLQSHGYTVLTARDGEKGWRCFIENRPMIDLVLSDFGLPKFDGGELYKRIRQIDRDVPFAIVTGFMAPEKRTELTALGVADIISKPHKPAELLTAVRRMLDVAPRTKASEPAR